MLAAQDKLRKERPILSCFFAPWFLFAISAVATAPHPDSHDATSDSAASIQLAASASRSSSTAAAHMSSSSLASTYSSMQSLTHWSVTGSVAVPLLVTEAGNVERNAAVSATFSSAARTAMAASWRRSAWALAGWEEMEEKQRSWSGATLAQAARMSWGQVQWWWWRWRRRRGGRRRGGG
ncbi:hypothetical protein HPP92_002155 [Vanilla planifolia]|uniref:Uncharacterized protein n=1 Tax=Vanilla planifolia TaxID=51239 RepID=A0A835RSW8_VANPL|nr:hypothetical protein HPP92_002155 [Vanilla planifolia]